MRNCVRVLLVGTVLVTAGCDNGNDQQLGTVIGGAIGAGAGYFVGPKNGKAIATALGAGAGALIGGAIGRQLDEADRERAQEATMEALNQPIPAAYYYQPPAGYYDPPPASDDPPPPRHYWRHPRAAEIPPAAPVAPPEADYSPSPVLTPPVASPVSEPPLEAQEVTPAAETPAPMPATTLAGVPRAPSAVWVSDHSGATGSARVVAANEQPNGSQCRTLQENVQLASGQNVSDENSYCNSGEGQDDWHKI